jgi:hypothetical protein
MNIIEKPIHILYWLKQRLQFKYKEQEDIVCIIDDILNNYKLIPKKIPLDKVNYICKKYYSDFDMDSCEINMGYTDEQRNKIREMILDIASELCVKQ